MDTPIFQQGVADAAEIARIFTIDPFLLLHDANRVQDFLERRFFEKVGTFRDALQPRLKVFTNYEHKVKEKLKRLVRGTFSTEHEGCLSHLTKAYIPLGRVLKQDVLWFFPNAREFYNYVESHAQDPQRQFFLARFEDALAAWMWKDYAAYVYEKEKLESMARYSTELERVSWQIVKELRRRGLEEKLNRGTVSQRDLVPFMSHAHSFMQEHAMDSTHFHALFRQWSRVRQKNRILWGAYETGWSTFEFRLSKFCQEVTDFCVANEIEVVHAHNRYLYARGNTRAFYDSQSPVIPVDEIDCAYSAGGKLYYKRHGYFAGLKQSHEPTHSLSVFEMQAYGEFLDLVLAQDYEEALGCLWFHLDALGSAKVPTEELVCRTASSGMYKAYENGDQVCFYQWEPQEQSRVKIIREQEYVLKREHDGQRDFIMEPYREGKEIHYKKRFIMSVDDLCPDWNLYQQVISLRTADFVRPLLGKQTKPFVADALSATPEQPLEHYFKAITAR